MTADSWKKAKAQRNEGVTRSYSMRDAYREVLMNEKAAWNNPATWNNWVGQASRAGVRAFGTRDQINALPDTEARIERENREREQRAAEQRAANTRNDTAGQSPNNNVSQTPANQAASNNSSNNSGSNSYSEAALNFDSKASQNLHVVTKDGGLDGIKCDLQVIPKKIKGYDMISANQRHNARTVSDQPQDDCQSEAILIC